MQEIKTISDLEVLKGQISTIRSKLKRTPSKNFWLDRNKILAHEKICTENEQAYAALPKEILVSPEMEQLLLNLFLDDLKARQAIEDKAQLDKHATKTFVKSIKTIFHPSLRTIASLADSVVKGYAASDRRSNSLEELARNADKNMKEVLGSYGLMENADGNFILKRGSWFVYDVLEWTHAGQASNASKAFYTGIKDVGVSRDLFPPDQQYLIDQHHNYPGTSPQVGRW